MTDTKEIIWSDNGRFNVAVNAISGESNVPTDEQLVKYCLNTLKGFPPEAIDILVKDLDPEAGAYIKNSIRTLQAGGTLATSEAQKVVTTLSNKFSRTVVGKKIGEKVVQYSGKYVASAAGKRLAKMTPGLSLAIGLECARERLQNGEPIKATFEVMSGAAATVPVVGTAISATIDVGLFIADMCSGEYGSSAPPKDHIQRTDTCTPGRYATDLINQEKMNNSHLLAKYNKGLQR